MNIWALGALMVICVAGQHVTAQDSFEDLRAAFESINEALAEKFEEVSAKVSSLRETVKGLARQTLLQQFFAEERVRSDGDSGVRVVRGGTKGPANYYGNNHIGGSGSFNALHDHSNYDRTIGMGEVVAVLNGVEFRTRHNDYKLVMASKTSREYGAVEPIPFPDVPPAVASKGSVEEQVEEMRQWFKAFKDQDPSVRDYRKYFKPVMCYMEGAWTTDTKALQEPFVSSRHKIDADSWFQLQDRVRYASYTGTKSRLENYAYLPTTIMAVNDTTGQVTYAQWNYRILCKPIKQDVKLSYFKQMEDLSYRYPRSWSKEVMKNRRTARFRFYEHDKPQFTKYGLLDEIFYTIPGKDNLPTNLTQEGFGDAMYSLADKGNTPLNAGYYHRWFKFALPGAMGQTTVARGYNDENMWVAATTQPRVAPISVWVCRFEYDEKRRRRKVCGYQSARYSYAIPLEIVFMTPLLSWNPHNIDVNDQAKVTAGGRNGRKDKPYDGAYKYLYYRTPTAFFKGTTTTTDKADTVRGAVYVLDTQGKSHQTTASGTRIVLPEIEGVGPVRLRYPIAPVHGEGSSAWKELNALRDMVLEETEKPKGPPKTVLFSMIATKKNPPGRHGHDLTVSWDDFMAMLVDQKEVDVTTTETQGHKHALKIHYNIDLKRFEYVTCDGKSVCWDQHPRKINIGTKSEYINMALPKQYVG